MPDTITPPEGGFYVGNQEDVENAVIFSIGDPEPVEVLKLTKDGLYYQGEFVDDAGQALTALTEWINRAKEQTIFGKVSAFNKKFGLEPTAQPDFPEQEIWMLKNIHMQEELNEIRAACLVGDLEQYFDGIIDLVYVALGAAYLAGLPFEEGFRRVHEANMKKVRAVTAQDSKRGSTYDIIKPVGWEPPVLEDLLRKEKA